MKKTFFMAVTALMMAINMNAQVGYEDTKHEVSITLGVGSNSQLIDTYENVIDFVFGYSAENERYMEPISAEYYYHLNKWLSIGSSLTFANHKQDLYSTSHYRTTPTYKGKCSSNYYTLLPGVKFNFLRKTHFGLYSKAALGVTLRTESIEYVADDEYKDTDLLLNWQLSLIGIEGGSPYLRAFAELGMGEQGVVCAGIRYKF